MYTTNKTKAFYYRWLHKRNRERLAGWQAVAVGAYSTPKYISRDFYMKWIR